MQGGSPLAGEHGVWFGEEEFSIQFFPTVREFLYSVKRIGAGNALETQEAPAYMPKKLLAQMSKIYQHHFTEQGRIRATYHLLFGLYLKRM